jgi:hypothetical protein
MQETLRHTRFINRILLASWTTTLPHFTCRLDRHAPKQALISFGYFSSLTQDAPFVKAVGWNKTNFAPWLIFVGELHTAQLGGLECGLRSLPN